jgi:microcystin-dependent protein
MTEVYLGQIMMTGFGFAQRTFALCNGQTLSLQQNTALFSLLGTQFGGNGITNFQLPNLQGTALYGAGASVDPAWQPTPEVEGTRSGAENVALNYSTMPTHIHSVNVVNNAEGTARTAPTDAVYGKPVGGTALVYGPPTSGGVQLDPGVLAMAGGSQPHSNMQPFLVINFNIALSGYYPSRG